MDRIKNLVGDDSTKVQTAMRLYAMERLLDRVGIPMTLDFSTDDVSYAPGRRPHLRSSSATRASLSVTETMASPS